MRDPYTVLGVERSASADAIKKAYRRLAKKYHPDLHPGDKRAADAFKEVNAAYDLLSDATKRARFDRGEIDASGAEQRAYSYQEGFSGGGQAGAPFGHNFGADDIFADLFGRTRRSGRVRGNDLRTSIEIGFVDAALGARKRIMRDGRSLDVVIPPGTDDGQTLRLKGQGGPGLGGGPAGDMLVEIKVLPHPQFRREGDDIVIDLPISLSEAVLGGKITVPVLEGKVALNIPKGANTGTKMRIRGKGIPRRDGSRSDVYVVLAVMLPPEPDPDLTAFLARWAPSHPYKVRNE
ncbi:MAG: J domain-containing protein [Alphaproteobacteria bacterium]